MQFLKYFEYCVFHIFFPFLPQPTILFVFIYWALGVVSLKRFDPVEPGQGYAYAISMKEYFFTQFSVILT